MNTSTRAPLYDLFKLIVAFLLLALFLFLLIWTRPASTRPSESLLATDISASDTAPPPSTPTPAPASSTSVPPTDSPAPTLTSTPEPTETPQPTLTSTLIPSPTESPVPEETLPTPIVESTAEANVCEAYARSQLQVGMQATILRRLNFRSSPGIMNNWILTNVPGTEVEIVGGPACTRYLNGGSYLWWQIKLPNGLVGWSAEASAFGAFYFMEPAQ